MKHASRRQLTIAGAPVRAARGWIVVATILVGITVNVFEPRDLDPFWYVAAAGVTIGFVASLLLHEWSHAVVARRNGTQLSSINLPLFGGLPDDAFPPESPRIDAIVAAAGPITSLVLAFSLWFGWYWLFPRDSLLAGACGFLALINLSIGLASLMPGLPFDGGRIFRAFIWFLTDDLVAAARVAAAYGQGIAVVGLFSGVFMLSLGEPVAVWGAWTLLALWTINAAGRDSFLRTLWRETSRRVTVEDAGLSRSRRIDASRTIDDAIDDLLHGVIEGPMLVADRGAVVGIVSLARIRKVPRAIWTERTIGDVAVGIAELHRVQHDAALIDLVDVFDRTRAEVVLIETRGHITGATDQTVTTARIRERVRADRAPRRRRLP